MAHAVYFARAEGFHRHPSKSRVLFIAAPLQPAFFMILTQVSYFSPSGRRIFRQLCAKFFLERKANRSAILPAARFLQRRKSMRRALRRNCAVLPLSGKHAGDKSA
ncbi:hypothetical protein [Leisingera thetidis]|uniref:hypothetical protein n=1 Tax=Leisingera thetidis TaxID=2930199 RepID=UPI0021F73508|nr:hypothetical protein [Leisingera thetidis]